MNRTYASLLLAVALSLVACRKEYQNTTQLNGTDYITFEQKPCGTVLTGTLGGVVLAPGVYCFEAGATLTGLLQLDGATAGDWIFKIGTLGTGALTGTDFNMQLLNGANPCKVTWRVADGITLTDSNTVGTFLAGKDITLTRGSLIGRVWSQTSSVTITETVLTGCELTPVFP